MTNEISGTDHVNKATARQTSNRRIAVVTVLVAVATAVATIALLINGPIVLPPGVATTTIPAIAYPVGVPSASEPSGRAPPGPQSLAGYRLIYLNDFPGSTVPPGWDVFAGVPGGDPGGQFGEAHVTVSGGLLRLNTWRDP